MSKKQATARKDEELRAVLNLSSKAIGQESFCRQVEEWHHERVAAIPDPSGVARRRVEVGWKPEEILERVAAELGWTRKSCGVSEGETGGDGSP